MIYMLSVSELSFLITVAEIDCNSLSSFNNNLKNYEYRIEEAEALTKMSIVNEIDGTYKLTSEGKFLSEMLFHPDAIACVGKRTDKDGLYYLCRKEGIWIVHTYSEALNTYIIRSFFSTHLLAKWLKENLYGNYKIDLPSTTVLDLQLSYDEWYVFLLSQFVFMKKASIGVIFEGNDCYFTVDSLLQPEIINYFEKGLTVLSNPLQAERFTAFLLEGGTKKLKSVIIELVKKNVFTVKNGKLTYTNMTIEWIDNGLLINTLYFNYKKENLFYYTVLFSLRRNGITALYDSENSVRLISSSNIPWVFYLQ